MKTQKATFGMGCFWGPELIFSKLKGVVSASVGYMGGDEKEYPNPSYKQVCSHRTGYVEIVHIEFDSNKTSYRSLLDVFWKRHNPTTPNRQGFNIGNQYRSVIFYHTIQQKKEAEKSKKEAQKELTPKKTLFGSKKIVTEITKAKTFFKAEEYHQKYLEKRGKKTC